MKCRVTGWLADGLIVTGGGNRIKFARRDIVGYIFWILNMSERGLLYLFFFFGHNKAICACICNTTPHSTMQSRILPSVNRHPKELM